MINQQEQDPKILKAIEQQIYEQQRQYEDYKLEINNQLLDQYEVLKADGKGKFCNVYQAISNRDGSYAAIKVLKPVRPIKIKRQVFILNVLKQCPNSIKLLGVTLDQASKNTCLIFPYIKNKDIRELMDQLITLPRIRKYIFQVLQALKYAHSKNIYHRDIKPQNILYDPQTEQVFVADWGLADYCFPGRVQSLKLGSRCYRAPQLYLLNQNYDCSVDIWAVGCVFGALLFYKNTLFRGNSNDTQIQEIAEVAIGTEQIKSYVHKFSLSPDKKLVQFLNSTTIQKKPWSSLIYKKYKETASEEALDLLSKMLTIDHTQRITAQQALNHKFFSKE